MKSAKVLYILFFYRKFVSTNEKFTEVEIHWPILDEHFFFF